jgi:hypothetical protein
MKLATVNVIELLNDSLQNVYSFPDTPEGNAEAEAQFKACHLQHNDPDGTTGVDRPDDDEWNMMLSDGIYDDECGYKLIITHSNTE